MTDHDALEPSSEAMSIARMVHSLTASEGLVYAGKAIDEYLDAHYRNAVDGCPTLLASDEVRGITMSDAETIAVEALQSACESDPADPEHPDTICISTDDFEVIVRCAVENWAEGRTAVRATLAAENAALTAKVERLKEALSNVEGYSSDTLTGRADGSADQKWYRDGFRVILKIVRAALKGEEG